MESAPDLVYLRSPEFLIVLFDLREPSGPLELHRQRAAWAEYSDIEALDEHHFALIIRPGWASKAAA